jgi:hypothetical protein
MKPEGPSNAGLVILRTIQLGWACVMAGWLIVSALWSLQFGVPFAVAFRQVGMWFSIPMAAVIVVAVATSRWARMVSAEVQFADKDKFVAQATEALIKYQCKPVSSEGSTLTFTNGFPRSMVYDALSIHLRDGSARIVGPMYYVRHVLKAVGGES